MKTYQKIFDKPNKEYGTAMTSKNQLDENSEKLSSDHVNKPVETIIQEGIDFTGDIRGAHDLYLNGEFNGTVNL